ncbi:MAG: hypothetical protein V3R99_01665 [Thermoguttaceae bacterium]
MKLSKTASFEELQVVSRFESLRKILKLDQYADHLDKPLAFWALPADRRLPLAFLGRKLGDLLETPFSELSGTPGIGQKKIDSFVKLLSRVANTDPSELPVELDAVSGSDSNGGDSNGGDSNSSRSGGSNGPSGNGNGFSPDSVSEILWGRWCATVVKQGLENETLGRFAPSLKNMTRVIWNKPLGDYVNYSLEEIRTMKTHGEKRVNAILNVFYSAHTLAANMGMQDHLIVRIVPRLIDRVEQWIGNVLQQPGMPSEAEILDNFVGPLLDQVRIDATRQIASLAESRLGTSGPPTSVRHAARTMGLTRARVYQLLNEINDIMNVRWPDGRHQVYELQDKIRTEAAQIPNAPDLRQFLAAVELFYPGCRRGAAGPLEQAPAPLQPSQMVHDLEATV